MASLKLLAGQTGVYGLSSIIGKFLNYLLVPLYTAKFVPTEYGVVTEFYAYVVVLQILLTYGMETGYFRFSNKYKDSNTVFTTVLTSILTTTIAFLVVVLIFSKNISEIIGYAENSTYVVIFSFILSLDAISSIFFARLRRLNKAAKFATYKLINIGLNIAFNLFFILLCPLLLKLNLEFITIIYKPDFGVGYIFVANLIASSVVLILFIPDFFKIKFKFDKKLWKQIILYSLPLLVTGLTGAVNEMADRILIKYWTYVPLVFVDSTDYVMYQVGIYGANAKLAVIMMMFVQAFRYAAEPFFFNNQKNETSLKIFADVMKYYIIVAFTMFLIILLNLDIVKYFINKTYFEGLNVVLPLFLSRLLVGVFFVLSFWYKLNDLTKYGILIFLAGAILTISMNYFLIPKFGYIGAAWTNFAAYSLMVIISFIWSRKYMKVPYQYFTIFIYTILAIIIYLISTKINFTSTILNLLIKNLLLFAFVLYVFKKENLKFSQKKKIFKKSQ